MAKILIVEDNRLVREALRDNLKYYGHDVTEAASLEEGLDKFKEVAPDLVVTDLEMPRKKGLEGIKWAIEPTAGIELTRAIRSEEGEDPEKKVPIFMHTSEDSQVVELEFKRAGGDTYFIKPDQTQLLVEEIIQALTREPGAGHQR